MNFYEFLMQQNKKKDEYKFDASATIAKFKALIEEFYKKIDAEWLSGYLSNDLVKTGLEPISISEERLGTYQVNSKWIEIAGKRISIMPVGTVLIGTDARFDISYGGNERMVIHNGSEWKLFRRDQRVSSKTIDATVFQNLIVELMS